MTDSINSFVLCYQDDKEFIRWHIDGSLDSAMRYNMTIITGMVPEMKQKLFVYFMDLKYSKRSPKPSVIRKEWETFEGWYRWFEACKADFSKATLPDYSKLKDVYNEIQENSSLYNE